MAKENFWKRNIGITQIILGVLLVFGSIFFGVSQYNQYNESMGLLQGNYYRSIQYFYNSTDFSSEEIKLMTILNSAQRSISEGEYLILKIIILESLCTIIVVQSLLLITQGLINSRKN